MKKKKKNILLLNTKKIVDILHKIEEYFLVFILLIIILLSFSQITLRNLSRFTEWFNKYFIFKNLFKFLSFLKPVDWFDPVIRYSVLWLGLMAAAITTLENKHINVDIVGRFSKGRLKSTVLLITNLFAFIVCIILCITSYIYIKDIEFTSTDPAPFLNIRPWVLIIVMPFSFGIIGIRFFIHLMQKIYNLINNCEDRT